MKTSFLSPIHKKRQVSTCRFFILCESTAISSRLNISKLLKIPFLAIDKRVSLYYNLLVSCYAVPFANGSKTHTEEYAMNPQVYGIEHILYIVITTAVAVAGLLLAKKFAKTEKSQKIVLKSLAFLLFCAILANRLSQVFRYDTVRWHCIIPDSFCGMTSLVLSLAVLFGKRDNPVLHFVWLLGLFGGISTVVYPTFVSQAPSLFYLPTISGLLHHSFSATLVVALFMFKQIDVTYKKWYCTFFGFTCYLTLGAFLMHTFNLSDAFHIAEPLLPDTPLTAWVMAPIYAVSYALILLGFELVKRRKAKSKPAEKDKND